MVWWFPSTGGARRGAYPLDPMEYVFTEGTASPYDVMYDTVHAVPATPVSAAQSEWYLATGFNNKRNLVRASNGTLYVVYDKLLAGKYQIYVIRSEDDGATWTDDTRISTYAGMAINDQHHPAIAVDSNDYLHVVWRGKATGFGTLQIWYALYDGLWQDPVRISTYAGMHLYAQGYPTISVGSNDNLHAGWHGKATGFTTLNQTWYATAVPPYAAGDWVTPIRISTYANMGINAQGNTSIAVDSNDHVHAVWLGQATGYTSGTQIWHARGVPPYATANWTTPVRISTAANMATKTQTNPCIAIDSDDNLHVVWQGGATDFGVIYQIRYAKGVPPYAAGDWVTPIRISDALNMGTNHQWYPSIAVDSSDYIHVLWNGKATGYLAQDVVWYATYVLAWATPVCIQPTGRNQYPNLRWSRWPR